MTDALEVAWAAGLFEGEGSIHANTIKGRIYLLLNLSSNDRDVVERFARAIGCGRVYGPYLDKNATNPRWSWHAKSKADSAHALSLLEPFLCVRRRAKLAEVRARVEAQPAPQTGPGVTLSDERRAKLSDGMKRYWAEGRYQNQRPRKVA
jgi:hypothetical protein